MKILIKKLTAYIICIPFLFSSFNAAACTIFTQSGEDMVLAGNNEDFYYSYPSMYWIVRGDNEYSRICFGNSTYVQGGMNEKGLFYDGAACPQSSVPYDESKASLDMDAGEIVLSKCATVKEAVEFLSGCNITSGYGDHLLFADSSGDSAVVEWLEDEMRVVWGENNRLIATNFFLTNTELGGYPCDRYNTVENALSELFSPNLADFTAILSSVSQNWGDGGTKYSNIYDLKALTVYVYNNADFSKVAVINLSDELEKPDFSDGSPIDVSDLSYVPASSVFNGENVNCEEAQETIAVGDTPDDIDTDIAEPDVIDDTGSVVPLFLVAFGVIVVAAFAIFRLYRSKR